jgi:hypothetical protein
MKQLDVLWGALKRVNKNLDSIEERVARITEPHPAESRETPFILTEKFIFNPREPSFEIAEQTLVSSAGVTTKITRLNYACYLRLVLGGIVTEFAFRPTARGLVFVSETQGNGPGPAGPFQNDEETDIAMFDFEWNLNIGSTEREYAKVYGDVFRGFCCRDSLGNYDQQDSLIISDDHPLILGSNQFLNFKVRPTLFGFFSEFYQPPFNGEVVLAINAIGYRSLSDV